MVKKFNCYTIVFSSVLLLNTIIANAQEVKLVDRNWIEYISQNTSDTTYILNFWATWCKPCVEELPEFEKLTATYSKQKVKVILVSCDFRKQLETKVKPFIQQQNIKSMVVLMNESDPNTWIERVDSKFTGAIPATLIINGKKDFRYFTEGQMTFDELQQIIKPLIQ